MFFETSFVILIFVYSILDSALALVQPCTVVLPAFNVCTDKLKESRPSMIATFDGSIVTTLLSGINLNWISIESLKEDPVFKTWNVKMEVWLTINSMSWMSGTIEMLEDPWNVAEIEKKMLINFTHRP